MPLLEGSCYVPVETFVLIRSARRYLLCLFLQQEGKHKLEKRIFKKEHNTFVMDIFSLVMQRNKISTCWYSILGSVYQLKVTKETKRMCLMLRFLSVWLFLVSAITILVLNLNMTGGSASSCSSLREALLCFLQGDLCQFSPAYLTECSSLPPLCVCLKFCHCKPTCASHVGSET